MPRARPHPDGRPHDDLVSLLAMLNDDLIIELGKPAPPEKALPKRVGRCPASHNRALFGTKDWGAT